MAVSPIEEKILGRLAKQTAPTHSNLSGSLYQVLGLSILLSRKLVKARRVRKLDTTRDTKSLQLYHHILWLTREGLWITDWDIWPFCEKGQQGPECRVMAAKLRASFYHIYCIFHNSPPISQLSARSTASTNSPSTILTSKSNNGRTFPAVSQQRTEGAETRGSGRRAGKAPLRDPIPSMGSETSYITNPYAPGQSQSPAPSMPVAPVPNEARRTPNRPPGLTPIDISPTQTTPAFLPPSRNFVPMTRQYFERAEHLANSLLSPVHALRLSISLEHAVFLRDCAKDPDEARRLARRTIKQVYASSEGLDDDEFADAAALVQTLGGIVRQQQSSQASQPTSSPPPPAPPQNSASRRARSHQEQAQSSSPNRRVSRAPPPIDRTIAVSPTNKRPRTGSPSQIRSMMKTPERLATVPEVDPAEIEVSPPVSRLSSRSRSQRAQDSSTPASERSSKRRAVESSQEQLPRTRDSARSSPSRTSRSNGNGKVSGYVDKPLPPPPPVPQQQQQQQPSQRRRRDNTRRQRSGGNG